MVFTRSGPSSSASARDSASTPANAAVTIAAWRGGRTAATPVTNVIDPPAGMCGAA